MRNPDSTQAQAETGRRFNFLSEEAVHARLHQRVGGVRAAEHTPTQTPGASVSPSCLTNHDAPFVSSVTNYTQTDDKN